MRGLLDTHTFIWWDVNPAKLSASAMAFIKNPSNSQWLSVVSVWEMVIKVQLGKLALSASLPDILAKQQANGIQILPVNLDHVLAVHSLPAVHKDPFDRLLVAQAMTDCDGFLSIDPIFSHYPVAVVW